MLKNLKTNEKNKNGVFTLLNLSKNYFYLIELSCKNYINYSCKLIGEKLWILSDSKRSSSIELLKHDQYLMVLLVLFQSSDNKKLKEFLIKTIHTKQSMEFKEFFNFIFGKEIINLFKEINFNILNLN